MELLISILASFILPTITLIIINIATAYDNKRRIKKEHMLELDNKEKIRYSTGIFRLGIYLVIFGVIILIYGYLFLNNPHLISHIILGFIILSGVLLIFLYFNWYIILDNNHFIYRTILRKVYIISYYEVRDCKFLSNIYNKNDGIYIIKTDIKKFIVTSDVKGILPLIKKITCKIRI